MTIAVSLLLGTSCSLLWGGGGEQDGGCVGGLVGAAVHGGDDGQMSDRQQYMGKID